MTFFIDLRSHSLLVSAKSLKQMYLKETTSDIGYNGCFYLWNNGFKLQPKNPWHLCDCTFHNSEFVAATWKSVQLWRNCARRSLDFWGRGGGGGGRGGRDEVEENSLTPGFSIHLFMTWEKKKTFSDHCLTSPFLQLTLHSPTPCLWGLTPHNPVLASHFDVTVVHLLASVVCCSAWWRI